MNAPQHCLDCAALLYIDPASGALVDQWGERICSASYRDHDADLPNLPAALAAPVMGKSDRWQPTVPLAGARTTRTHPTTGPATTAGGAS